MSYSEIAQMELMNAISQAYDYIFDNDSGNRVFAMIMHLPSEKRRLAIGR